MEYRSVKLPRMLNTDRKRLKTWKAKIVGGQKEKIQYLLWSMIESIYEETFSEVMKVINTFILKKQQTIHWVPSKI